MLSKVNTLENTITDTLKKVVGSAAGVVNEAEILVLKTQATLLKTLTENLKGLPIVGDLLLPGLEKTLEGIEATVDATVKKIEASITGSATTAAPVVKLTNGVTIKLIPSTVKLATTARP